MGFSMSKNPLPTAKGNASPSHPMKEGYESDEVFDALLIIDDVGAEGDIRKFGNESPIGAIISTRARHWEIFGTPTIYTTNFDNPEKLAALYGNDKRLLDRLSSYQVGVEFTGASLRK